MLTVILAAVGVVVGGGIWFFESQKRKERQRDQAFQDEWLRRKGGKT